MAKQEDSLKSIVALCKRRGFIYPGSEIYGGFANTYSYGPYGIELKNNIKELWWREFVRKRRDIVGLDGPILLHPQTWKASGHVDGFNDAMIDCKGCRARFRADQLIEESAPVDASSFSLTELAHAIVEHKIKCPKCGSKEFTEPRHFNLMFSTQMSKTADGKSDVAFLRPETAQAIFLDFKNIVDTMRVKIPFGVAQIGKAFRNEITPGNFIFRVIEFEQMEIEYFIEESSWEDQFEKWLSEMHRWCQLIGLNPSSYHEKEHPKDKLSHYSKRTVDIVYDFPFGTSELYGLAYRTDFDLQAHSQATGKKLEYFDGEKRFVPHVIEPTFGVDRTILALLCDAYEEEKLQNGEMRSVLHLHPRVAPVKAAVFPLMNKDELPTVAKSIFDKLQPLFNCEYDDSGAIGKRYRRQDELGTPCCITVDYQTLKDGTVTLRDRDSMAQERVKIDQVVQLVTHKISQAV